MTLTCCLCGKVIPAEGQGGAWTEGHNAEPIKRGRCCAHCNDHKVTPARLVERGWTQEDARRAVQELNAITIRQKIYRG
jgi:hypothetical protein